MTQKELIQQNNQILKALVHYTVMNSAFRERIMEHQAENAGYLEKTGEVLPVPEEINQLWLRVGEATMEMAEAADLLYRYTENEPTVN